jgi:acyl-CoA thioesterase-1
MFIYGINIDIMMLKCLIICCLQAVFLVTNSADLQQKRIVFFGDSLTEGYGVPAQERYTSVLEDSLKKYHSSYTIINASVSGETSAGGLRRISWVMKQKIDIFVLALGSNDGLRGIDVASTKKNLSTIIKRVKDKNPHAKILVLGMKAPPNMGKDFTATFEKIYPELVEDYNTKFVPFLLKDVGGIPSLNIADGIHPNKEGHQILAKRIWKKLREMLE